MARVTRPAEPEELTPEDDPYPLPSTPQLLVVTPEAASSWLSYRDTPKNRPISKVVAARYQADMQAGRWREATPEGYIFDTDGYWISGRHRARAQANGGITLEMWIFPNQPRDIAGFLDQGFRRTAAHVIRQPYGKDMGSGAKHLAALADRDRYGMPRFNQVMVPEVVETFRAWPELNWYPSEVWAVWRACGIPTGPHLAVLAQAARTDHRLKIQPWLEGLRRGANLGDGDARLLLRERFSGGFVSLGQVNRRDHQYALIVKAWNAFVTGEPLRPQGFRFKYGELLPAVAGFEFEKKGRAA